MLIDFIVKNFYYLFLGWLVLNMMQRRYRERGHQKRMATLFQSILIFIVYIGASVIKVKGLSPQFIAIPFAIVAILIGVFRSKIFPYKRYCRNCGAKLNMNQIFLFDANLCSDCDPYEKEEESKKDDDTPSIHPEELE